MGSPKESWLRSTPEKCAEAMERCQNPSGECFYRGVCDYGDCFDKPSTHLACPGCGARLSLTVDVEGGE